MVGLVLHVQSSEHVKHHADTVSQPALLMVMQNGHHLSLRHCKPLPTARLWGTALLKQRSLGPCDERVAEMARPSRLSPCSPNPRVRVPAYGDYKAMKPARHIESCADLAFGCPTSSEVQSHFTTGQPGVLNSTAARVGGVVLVPQLIGRPGSGCVVESQTFKQS